MRIVISTPTDYMTSTKDPSGASTTRGGSWGNGTAPVYMSLAFMTHPHKVTVEGLEQYPITRGRSSRDYRA